MNKVDDVADNIDAAAAFNVDYSAAANAADADANVEITIVANC